MIRNLAIANRSRVSCAH